MEIEGFAVPLTMLCIGVVLIAAIAFFSGRKMGGYQKKMEVIEAEKSYTNKLNIEKSKNNELQREINNLEEKNQIYLRFLIKIPDAVKNLNSNLSLDETVSSVVRLTKEIVDAGVIELYIFNKETNLIELVAAYGSKKKGKVSIKYGVGLLGTAAENKITSLRTALQYSEFSKADDDIDVAAPILFKGEMIGMIGVGKIKLSGGNERRFISMIADLAGVAIQNCEHLETAKKEANTDALTGLYNRGYFFGRAIEASQKALNYNFTLSIFLFDIDHFKTYNDTNGHAEGDYLLKELSRLIKENSRGLDIIARYGGEEFIVLLPNTDKNGALIYAEKIRRLIENHPFKHREKQPSGCVSVSGGIATFPSDGDTIDAVVRCADKALYSSKKSGRNMVTRYKPFHFST
jgi:diguanylate cyclase (GGDEF)-like protein